MHSSCLLAFVMSFLPMIFAQVVDPGLVQKLRAAPTHVDRISLLKDEQFVFNFLSRAGESLGSAGRTNSATSANFPALIGNGVAMTVGYLEGCGMNIPHTHPRATEINIAINGTLRTGMLAENGARFVFNNVPAGSATVFPKGAVHFEMNTECEPTLFVAAFNDEDPGVLALAQRFFGLPTDIVAASLGSIGIKEIANLESKIPNNIAQGTKECLKRCGIKKMRQPTSQRQLRVAANALPEGYSGPSPPPSPPAPAPTGPAGGKLVDNPINGAISFNENSNSGTLPSSWSDKTVKSLIIALLTVNGVFIFGTLIALFFYTSRKRSGGTQRMCNSLGPDFTPLHVEKVEYYDPYHRTPSPGTSENS